MNVIVAILIFTVIVVVHELGHFWLAKKNGIGVTEFSVGMGPRLLTLVKTEKGFSTKALARQKEFDEREDWKDKTKYSWKLFPIGGSCMMLGEDDLVEDDSAFNKKSVWARISTIAAGPIFNFILAFLAAMVIISMVGYSPSKISSIQKGFPMEKAGLKEGDLITKINGTKINISKEVMTALLFDPLTDKPVDITYVRDGVKKTVAVTPIQTQEGVYKLGFGYSYASQKTSALGVLKYSFVEMKFNVVTTVKSLGKLVTGKINKDQIGGPVAIVDMVGSAIEEEKEYGFQSVLLVVLNFIVLISANLGIMNLLPLPALDGGRLVFLFIEVFRGKPIDQEKEGMVHLVGLAALMVLMVFVMFNDISRLFN